MRLARILACLLATMSLGFSCAPAKTQDCEAVAQHAAELRTQEESAGDTYAADNETTAVERCKSDSSPSSSEFQCQMGASSTAGMIDCVDTSSPSSSDWD